MATDWTMEEVEKLYALFRPTISTNRGKTLLLADSDDSTRNVTGAQLQQKGFTVWCAANTLETFAIFKDRKPDCCILDQNLTPLNGIDVLEALSREEGYDAVLKYISSGSATKEERLLSQIYGAEEVLRRPLHANAVADRIAEYFNRTKTQSNPD